jgi:hypothetical protein
VSLVCTSQCADAVIIWPVIGQEFIAKRDRGQPGVLHAQLSQIAELRGSVLHLLGRPPQDYAYRGAATIVSRER